MYVKSIVVYLHQAIAIKKKDMTKQEFINRRNDRVEFCINNNLNDLLDTVVTEVKLINIFNSLGIKTYMCIDPDCKDEFFEMSGISIEGRHDDFTNKMVFKLFKF